MLCKMCSKNFNLLFTCVVYIGVVLQCCLCLHVKTQQATNPRVCIVGAGIAGLTSSKYLKDEEIDHTVFEATRYFGGTWRYNPRVGTDEYGMPLFTSIYQSLRTNLPKPTMELRGFPAPKDMPSYPSWNIYYDYIKSYVKHFDLEKNIKFQRHVISVRRLENIWKVKYKHVPTGEEFVDEFDYVIVGTGHFTKPNWPFYPGDEDFNGTIIHSHDYKVPDRYKCRRVLLVGAGPSGMELSLDLADVTKTLIHSHHSKVNFSGPFPPNYVKKPDIMRFNQSGVIFMDGTYEEVDDVIYCTGFEYYYPFLDSSSGLDLQPRTVSPLYRHMVNINQPTMVLMGLGIRGCLVVALDAQARYATALIKGNFTLPSKKEMMADWQKRVDKILSRGQSLSGLHVLGFGEDQYYADLTKESGIERVPPVLYKIRVSDMWAKLQNMKTYRQYVYTVVNNETFTRTDLEDTFAKTLNVYNVNRR